MSLRLCGNATWLLVSLALCGLWWPLGSVSSFPSDSPPLHPVQSIFGSWTAPPNFKASAIGNIADGPLLGNGDLGVAISHSNLTNTLSFNAALNQFWSVNSTEEPPSEARVRALGGVSLTFLSLRSQLNFSARQLLYNATVVIDLVNDDISYHVTAYIHSRTNMLLVNVSVGGSVKAALDALVRLTTFTIGPYPTSTGCAVKSGPCSGTVDSDYITRDTFAPNSSFPISGALVTRVFGEHKRINATLTTLSVSSIVAFTSASPLSIAAVVLTNLDVAGLDVASLSPPKPVIGVDPLPATLSQSQALTLTAVLMAGQETEEDWQSFWFNSCIVELPDTPQLLRYYYGAQYALKASTRRGKVAPGLWGVWAVHDGMDWNGDYTLNYNYQAPTWGSYSSNQLDLAEAMYPPVIQYLPRAHLNAINLSCTTSLCVHFPVHIAPYGHSSARGPWLDLRQHFIAAFALLNLITHCEYVEDSQWCQVAYDGLKGAIEWYEFYLVKEPIGSTGNYRYIDPDDCTNENCGGEKPLNGVIPVAMIRRVFAFVIDRSLALGVDSDLRVRWVDILSHMAAIPTTQGLPPHTNLTVFNNAEDNTTDSTPRPGANPEAVYPIWPCGLVSIHSPLSQVGFNTITVYGTGGWTQGNALPIFHPSAVRVGYPATLVLDGWAQRFNVCLLANLFCAQRGGGMESSGATMAVNEMLMQSNEWAVNLFPVWPADLDARFVAMRARHRILVSAAYNKTVGRISGVEMWVDAVAQGGGKKEVVMRLMHPWQFTQGDKQRRAMEKLQGGRPVTSEKPGSQGEDMEVRNVVVSRRKEGYGLSVEDEVVVGVSRFDFPPSPQALLGVEYEQSEAVVWFEWRATPGYRYHIEEEQPQQLKERLSTD